MAQKKTKLYFDSSYTGKKISGLNITIIIYFNEIDFYLISNHYRIDCDEK